MKFTLVLLLLTFFVSLQGISLPATNDFQELDTAKKQQTTPANENHDILRTPPQSNPNEVVSVGNEGSRETSVQIDTSHAGGLSYRQKLSLKREAIRKAFITEDPNAVDMYTHGFLFGGAIHTDGWGLSFRWLRTINPTYSYHIVANLSTLTDSHEDSYTPYYISGNYVYQGSSTTMGKKNSFYPLRVGYGINRYMGNKASHKGVFLQCYATGGIIFGVQKTYGLEIVEDANTGKTKVITYDDQNAKYYSLEGNIKGHTFTAFFSGWDDLHLNPGLFIDAGARLGFSARKNFITAINLSLGVDYYKDEVPIMISYEAHQLFYRFSVGVEFGRTKMKR